MNLRAPFLYLLLGLVFFARAAAAHSPFDCSARVIVHEDSAEVSVTVGRSLGEAFLGEAQVSPGQLPNAHPLALPPGMAAGFFDASADGRLLAASAGEVTTDGIEFQFRFEYPLSPAKRFGVAAKFLPSLPAPRTAALVVTDENGNILGSALLTPEKTAADFSLPARLFPGATNWAFEVASATNAPQGQAVPVVAEVKTVASFGDFLRLGIGHILNIEAFDHLLFLTALLLGCRRLKTMLLVITGFTLAHSLTLALAALNVVSLSARVVEPAIAASIIFVAAENFRRSEKSWHRYALTCGFGLIHGFGFASALRGSGLGAGAGIAMPLCAFNLGVEIGQLTVAAVLLPLLLGLNRWGWFARHGTRVISGLVILLAVYWVWERTFRAA